jgi:hypothetical protein
MRRGVLGYGDTAIPADAQFFRRLHGNRPWRLAERFEQHYTPGHGSWLNLTEIALSVLARQCLDRRIASLETLEREATAWERDRNAASDRIAWHFTTADARVKLKRLYPNYQVVKERKTRKSSHH